MKFEDMKGAIFTIPKEYTIEPFHFVLFLGTSKTSPTWENGDKK